jgi:hypothetical protein
MGQTGHSVVVYISFGLLRMEEFSALKGVDKIFDARRVDLTRLQLIV